MHICLAFPASITERTPRQAPSERKCWDHSVGWARWIALFDLAKNCDRVYPNRSWTIIASLIPLVVTLPLVASTVVPLDRSAATDARFSQLLIRIKSKFISILVKGRSYLSQAFSEMTYTTQKRNYWKAPTFLACAMAKKMAKIMEEERAVTFLAVAY